MNPSLILLAGISWASLIATAATAQDKPQVVEGFAKVDFHHNANRSAKSLDFRGMAVGYMTAGWWAPGQMRKNILSWQTAVVPAQKVTLFSFIGASAVLPSEFTHGPTARLSVEGKPVLTFRLEGQRDGTWQEGGYALKYFSRRIEYPYFNAHRQLELNGNSGIFHLTVPAEAVKPGQPVTLQVEVLPFPRWPNGWFMVKHRTDVLKRTPEIVNGELDAMRTDLKVINQHTHMLATQAYKDELGTDAFEHRVLYRNGFRHLHPADLIKLQNGELLMMTREAAEHYAPDGNVVMLRSKDKGKTWGHPKVIAGMKEIDEREGCGLQLRDGTIVVGIFYNNLYKPDGSYNWGGSENLPERLASGTRLPHIGLYVIRSQDHGKTWSEPAFLDTTDMPFTELEGPTDAPIELPDGSVVMALTGINPKVDAKNRSALMVRSMDQGKTWQYLSTLATDPGGKLGGFMEPGIVRTKTGRIVAALRNHGPDHAIWLTHSDDDGKTWAPVTKTGMIGHPTDLVQLSDGRLLASYGIRTPHTRPTGVRCCFSSDNGETWDITTELQLRNDFGNWDVGYPESLELEDGRVLTVYYYNQLGKYYLGGTFWKPSPANLAP